MVILGTAAFTAEKELVTFNVFNPVPPSETELTFNAYEKVVEGYGGKGYYVENHDTLDETLKRAKEDAKLGYPVLVNVKISKSDFRKGSISV